MPSLRFQRFAWGTLAFIVGVILWGAIVRATDSGAGCGSHWPLCNGEVLPRSPGDKTLIELSHRATSGLSGLLVLGQLVWALRIFPKGHRVRRAAAAAALLMILEGAIGAGIVLLEYVGGDASVNRAAWMVVHLVNTFLLVAALTVCANWAGGAHGVRLRGQGAPAVLGVLALIGTIAVGASGAIAALGDTLFPATDLGSALGADLSPAAHFLVRLRIIHPVLAVVVAFLILGARFVLAARREKDERVQRWGSAVRVLVIAQMAAGLLNMSLLAPTSLQIVHLFLADALWIALVSFVGAALAGPAEVVEAAGAEQAA